MVSHKLLHIGLDIGSTTVKCVVLDQQHTLLFSTYRRHYSEVRQSVIELIKEIHTKFPQAPLTIAAAGSGGISVSRWMYIPFVQEVIASTEAIRTFIPDTEVAIELGGEDAKITFFDAGIDQRMNETCAGGTGAFIDQMAVVLQTDAAGLNTLAAAYNIIYPIAARCGVFAKTDVMPLLNEGAAREDIAASIFQAVVDQTVGGLACGRRIRGKVAFLGGPLYFLSQLRQRFIDTLALVPEEVIFPEHSQLFVAMGAALLSVKEEILSSHDLYARALRLNDVSPQAESETLPPLFDSEATLQAFLKRHAQCITPRIDIADVRGDVYLGLDAGSTTTKAVLIDSQCRIAYTWYGSNEGKPLGSALRVLQDLYSKLPDSARLHYCVVTGYGEGLLKAGLGIDEGEVETIAHYKAAAHLVPDVSFILDIGGQDMKCLYIRDGMVDKIVLNEACSSGCGSFVENFAKSLGLDIHSFAQAALKAQHPVDLGSRCTVFMNSRVKQAQKEGASQADISAGLAYAVIKNALYKVIKISDPKELGKQVVVQGGTFFNQAVLRALEQLLGRPVVRPDIAGLMGAFGAALLAKERARPDIQSGIIRLAQLADFTVKSRQYRCRVCANSCLMTSNTFANHSKFVSGNRCERGLGIKKSAHALPNLFADKLARLFDYYVPLAKDDAPYGEIGIPRVLNMYEDYPFWFTFFTTLGYRVILSDESSRDLFASGLETIPSQTACYPAKMVHGHITNLLDKAVRTIFYPCLTHEQKEFTDADNHYNCPVVATYPEAVRLNMDSLQQPGVHFIQPFLPVDPDSLVRCLYQTLSPFRISKKAIAQGVRQAQEAQSKFRHDVRQMGEQALARIKRENLTGIVLAGRPYHLDPAIHHGIPELIAGNQVAILTEDSVAHLSTSSLKLSVVDQWAYHSRLYRAAEVVAGTPELELIQMNSFGCGLDAVTTDQVERILARRGKSYTLLKIDEGSNLGAVRIRIRSLLAALKERHQPNIHIDTEADDIVPFTRAMKDTHTILCPQLSPLHFSLLSEAFASCGYRLAVLPQANKEAEEEGLKYVNNDACYPAILVVGQLIQALKSGQHDPGKTALIISQTGGGCRASNYVSFLRTAVRKAGFPNVPVIPFNMSNMQTHPGFEIPARLVKRILLSFSYGDLLLRVGNRTRPYEAVPGSVDALIQQWIDRLRPSIAAGSRVLFTSQIKEIVADFDRIALIDKPKPKVGIVGEILVKFHPCANKQLISIIEQEGGEAVVPDFIDFITYTMLDSVHCHQLFGGLFRERLTGQLLTRYIEWFRKPLRQALAKSQRFDSFTTTRELVKYTEGLVSVGNQSGEGWLLTAEMVKLIETNTPNIVLVQPFACLPNHITGKGVLKALKQRYPYANIVAIDYDPGTTEVNQLNRIKLMMSVAHKGLASAEETPYVIHNTDTPWENLPSHLLPEYHKSL